MFKDVPLETDTSRVLNNGVVIQVGAIAFDQKQVLVPDGIYIANLAAGEKPILWKLNRATGSLLVQTVRDGSANSLRRNL